MTRYARGGQANRKKPNEASSWAEMKADLAVAAKKGDKAKPDKGGGGKVITRLKNGHYVVRIGGYERVLRSEAELRRWKRAGSERRRLQRKERRQADRVCFHCRQPGHLVGDCPDAAANQGEGGGDSGAASVCFRCGSGEHSLSACPKMPKAKATRSGDEPAGQAPDLPFARCFVCGQVGHLSRACPDNPRGLYPRGGGCLLCSSVEHLKRDCPLAQKRRAAESAAQEVALLTAAAGADDEVPMLSVRTASAAGIARQDDGEVEMEVDASRRHVGSKKRKKPVKVVVLQ